jgi:hypothetical protein
MRILQVLAISVLFLALIAVDLPCCYNCPPPCDYPFRVEFSNATIDNRLGSPADFEWSIDVVNGRGKSQMSELIVKDSSSEDHPVVVVSKYTNSTTESTWLNIVPLPGLALMNASQTQMTGALLLMVVLPYDPSQVSASYAIGDYYNDLSPDAAAFVLYGPVDSYGQIPCYVPVSGSCSGEINIGKLQNNQLSASISGLNYAIDEKEITDLVSQGTELCAQ